MSMPTITGRTVKVGTKSFSAMEEELRQLHAKIAAGDEVPPGAFSTIQYAKANGVLSKQAYRTLNRAVDNGLLEQFSLRAPSDKGIRLQQFFRVKR